MIFIPNGTTLLLLDQHKYVQVIFRQPLICERYERRSILMTCNHPFSEWDKIFKEPTMAVAAVDRLVHHARIIELMGESYRKKEALNRQKLTTKSAISKAENNAISSNGAIESQEEAQKKIEVKNGT